MSRQRSARRALPPPAPGGRGARGPARTARALEVAIEHHRHGRLDAAREGYTGILATDPGNFDALHLTGVLAAQTGEPQIAVRLIRLALNVRPGSHEALNNLGSALQAAGDDAGAAEAFGQALGIAPDYVDALQNLGGLLHRTGRHDEAATLLRHAARLAPGNAGVLNNLGNALQRLGRVAEAEAAFRAATARAPGHLQALLNLGNLLLGEGRVHEAREHFAVAVAAHPASGAAQRALGTWHERAGDREAALACCERAAGLDPSDGIARNNLGMLLLEAGSGARALHVLREAAALLPGDAGVHANLALAALRGDSIDEGIRSCHAALALDPVHVPALVNLSALERCRGRFDLVEDASRRALAIAPGYRKARINLAGALVETGRIEEGEREYRSLVEADPTDAEARWNLAISRLARGAPELAWDDFEWRWRLRSADAPRPTPAREWDGSAPGGRSIFLWPEQGLGDHIVFASMVPDLVARGAHVTMECDPRLVSLFRRALPESVRVIPVDARDGLADTDWQTSMGSLARVLRPSPAAFPASTRHLVPDPEQAAAWRSWLATLGPGLRVGISWRSHNLQGERRIACTTLDQWSAVLAVPGVRFVCLQYDECSHELARSAADTGTAIHVPRGLDQKHDLDGVAALLSGLDLVISAPTTVSVLAGAVGTPTWQLCSGIDWHGLGAARSPWQPSVRRLCRPWNRAWTDVLGDVAAELAAQVSRDPGSPGADGRASPGCRPALRA